MTQGIYAAKESFERAIAPIRKMQEQAEVTALSIRQMHYNLERICQTITSPFGESNTPPTAPVVIEHEPPTPHHYNNQALRTAKNEQNLRIENQILLKVVELLAEKPKSEMTAPLLDMPLIANTLALQASEITNLTAQLEQKEQEINKLQAKIDQLQATATPANHALTLENLGYTTTHLEILKSVIQEFWINHQKEHIPPKQDTIINWIIKEYGLTRAAAKAIDQVARPDITKTGGIKSRK